MDPSETLSDLMDALTGEDWDDAYEAVSNLQEWLDNGGFPPEATRLTWQHLTDGIKRVLEEVV